MSEIVLNALVRRRAELTGEDTALRAKLAQIAADIGHLDAVIRQFDPDYNLANIKGKRPRNREAARRGETSRAVLGLLREAGAPISTAEVVGRMMAQRGMDAGNRQAVKLMAKRISTTLARQEKHGTVRSVREPGQYALWEIVK
jgi:hypothetical protein